MNDMTPQQVKYAKHDEWADNVHQQLREAEEKSVSFGDYSGATYFILKRWEHERQVEREKRSYNGL